MYHWKEQQYSWGQVYWDESCGVGGEIGDRAAKAKRRGQGEGEGWEEKKDVKNFPTSGSFSQPVQNGMEKSAQLEEVQTWWWLEKEQHTWSSCDIIECYDKFKLYYSSRAKYIPA